MSTQRKRFTRFAAALALAGVAGVVHAQAFPSRPITIVIPFPPGGISDNSTRVIAQKAQVGLGQPIVIENRPGAGGQIGADVVKGAKPDGHTLYLANIGSHGINQSLYSKLSYDPMKDFEPVTLLFSSPTLVVVPAASPVKSMAELIAYAKTKPGKASYGSQSIGSGGHLSGEIVKMKNGLDLIHVPYKGSAPALTDLVAGRIDFLFDPITTALPFVKDGKLRALAITVGQALAAPARRADARRARLRGLRREPVVRARGAGGNAAPDHRPPERGVRQGGEGSGGRQAPRRPGHRGDEHDARAVRRVHPRGNRAVDRGREELGGEGGLNG